MPKLRLNPGRTDGQTEGICHRLCAGGYAMFGCHTGSAATTATHSLYGLWSSSYRFSLLSSHLSLPPHLPLSEGDFPSQWLAVAGGLPIASTDAQWLPDKTIM